MKAPLLTGLIDRRILLNFRAAPEVVNQLLPHPFRAQQVQGMAIVGICLIRLRHERIKGLPPVFGLASENGAHRIAVEWEANGHLHSGVYIPRRDTSSAVNALVGNQLLGIHYHSTFLVAEAGGRYAISFQSADGTQLTVKAQETDVWPTTSLFADQDQASDFFRRGAAGYSPRASGAGFDGVELQTTQWKVSPLAVQHVSSSFFADSSRFPVGSVVFDNALLMRDVSHDWKRLPAL
ncbi:DUF2071 domain-containing protein [Siccationidurans soli]|uniref:DUF2071 domain-containing protein n=2 Tax=Hymenobacter negativus TaxID=2795026 RepID=A0ABS3QNJ0_9BACT|nr:DUF2071 domain-containing protein [Hymenobacter negativus]